MESFYNPIFNQSDKPVAPVTTLVRKVKLAFRQTGLTDIDSIRPLFEQSPYRTCDFSVGGLFMWVDYFRYSHCIYNNTLFTRGVSENDMSVPAFSLPIGEMPLHQSIPLLKEYCDANDIPLILSAVPEPAIEQLMTLGATSVEELTDWADYLYEAGPMSTFAGKKLSKKRNHVNHFISEFPEWSVEPLSDSNLRETIEFFERQHLSADKSLSADYERLQVLEVLRNMGSYRFEGEVLSVPSRGIVAFTMGEVIGDTLYVHIEKMDHEVAGSGEMISRHFVESMIRLHPGIEYVNREEDTGDEGLRAAKLAYRPSTLLRKYNVRF